MSELISVIMPVRNGSNYIEEALESIERQGMAVEVIVVDDGSTDDTALIASAHGAKVIRHPVCRGPVIAKNSGIAAATGDYVVFFDHDDIMRDNSLKTLYRELSNDPVAAAVEAQVKDFLSPEIGPMPGIVIRPEPYYGLFTGAILIRRSVFDVIGPFDAGIKAGEMISWFSKMEQNDLSIKKIDFVATDRRIHRTNFGQTSKEVEYKDYARVLRERIKALRRQ